MKQLLKRIRYFIIRNIFTHDEKYLIIRAIDERIGVLERVMVNEKWANKEEVDSDIRDYWNFRFWFTTRDYV